MPAFFWLWAGECDTLCLAGNREGWRFGASDARFGLTFFLVAPPFFGATDALQEADADPARAQQGQP
jgi:hypothetical protein